MNSVIFEVDNKKIWWIDFLKGIAILMVICVHVGTMLVGVANLNSFVGIIIEQGAKGVQIFFIISAITTFYSFDKKIKIEKFSYINFLIKKLNRLAPLWILVSLAWFVIYAIFKKELLIENLIIHIFFLNGVFPLFINSLVSGGWFVGTLVLFYLIAPILYKYIKSTNQSLIFFLISIIISVAFDQYIFQWLNLGYFSYMSLPMQLPVFALGIFCYFIVIKKDFSSKIILDGLLMISGIVLMINLFFVKFFYNYVYFSIFFVLGMFVLNQLKDDYFNNNFINYLGKNSYSIYLVHFFVLTFLINNSIKFTSNFYFEFVINFVLLLVITLVLCKLIEIIYEKPFMNLIRRKNINKY